MGRIDMIPNFSWIAVETTPADTEAPSTASNFVPVMRPEDLPKGETYLIIFVMVLLKLAKGEGSPSYAWLLYVCVNMHYALISMALGEPTWRFLPCLLFWSARTVDLLCGSLSTCLDRRTSY